MRSALGIDIGGTKVAFALIDEDGAILATHRIKTDVSQGASAMLDHIADGIQTIMHGHDLKALVGVGIGTPGNVDRTGGVVRLAVNLNWQNVAVRDELINRIPALPTNIIVDTDVQAWVAAERVFGQANDTANFLYFALGTGLGATAIVNGQPVRGVANAAMELGHVIVQDSPRRRLEEYVSGIGMMTLYDSLRQDYPDSPLATNPDITTYDILQHPDDPLSQAILTEMTRWFGHALAWACTAYNPAVVIVGGGFGQALMPHFMPELLEYVCNHTLPPIHDQLEIRASTLEESAVGPACLIWLNH